MDLQIKTGHDDPLVALDGASRVKSITPVGRHIYAALLEMVNLGVAKRGADECFSVEVTNLVSGWDGSERQVGMLKDLLTRVVGHCIEWEEPGPSQRWVACTLLSTVSLEENDGRWVVGFAYANSLAAQLRRPGQQVVTASTLRANLALLLEAQDLGIDGLLAQELYCFSGDHQFNKALREIKSSGAEIGDANEILRTLLSPVDVGAVVNPEDVDTGPIIELDAPNWSNSFHAPRFVKMGETPEARRTQQVFQALLRMDDQERDSLTQAVCEELQHDKANKPKIRRLKDGKWMSSLVLGDVMEMYLRSRPVGTP